MMDMSNREIEQLIQRAFDGDLPDAEAARLREILRASPEALDRYCEHALLVVALKRHASSRIAIPGAIPFRTRMVELLRHRRLVRMAAMAAVAILMLGGLVLHLVWQRPGAPMVRIEAAAGSLLETAEGGGFSGDSLESGTQLRIGQGVVRLTFRSGAEAVVEGPSVVRVIDAGGLEMAGGSGWFHVPEKARGFTVECPGFSVTDLGTEFGLDLREDNPPQVHVLTGKVEAKSRKGLAAFVRLHAGDAVALTSTGRWLPCPLDCARFRNALPPGLPFMGMDFEDLRNGWLRLDGDAPGAASATARLVGEGGGLVAGIDGMALDLTGRGGHVETTWMGLSGTSPRTVALWCRVPEGAMFSTAPALAVWGNPALGFSRKFKVALCTAGGATVLRTSFGDNLFNGATPLSDGRWHHLAVVYRGNGPDGSPIVEMFVDGRPEAVTVAKQGGLRIQTDTASGIPLEFGRYELSAYGKDPHLRATIDRFRIFAGALSAAEIRDLAKIPSKSVEIR